MYKRLPPRGAHPSARSIELRSFSVWRDVQEQWDADQIDPPELTFEGMSAVDAAIELATRIDSADATFIVRDDEAGTFRRIELCRRWDALDHGTTLEELCSP